MAVVDVRAVANRAWRAVCSSAKNASVYLDRGAAEALHWNGGLARLLSAGALHVAELSPFEVVPAGCQKAVFVTASAVLGDVRETVRDIVTSARGHLLYVAVVTAVPAAAHTVSAAAQGSRRRPEGDSGGGTATFERLQEELLEWMGNANFTAEVVHVPLDVAAVADDLVIMPGQAEVWSALDGCLPDSYAQPQLNPAYQDKVKGLVTALDCFLTSAGITEECYYVGSASRHIATTLASAWPLAAARRRKATLGGSVLLVDRVLDLVTCLRHDPDSFLDRVLQAHEHFPCQHTDVAISMQPLVGHPEQLSARLVAFGCLSPSVALDALDEPADRDGSKSVAHASPPHEALLNAKSKVDALAECLRRLTDAAAAERLPMRQSSKLGSRISATEVLSLVQAFRSRYEAVRRHCSLLQASLAVCGSLDTSARGGRSPAASLDKLGQLEKVLMQAVGEGEVTAAANRLTEVIQKRLNVDSSSSSSDDHSMHQLLGLLLYLASLVDGETGPTVAETLAELQLSATSVAECIAQERRSTDVSADMSLLPLVEPQLLERRLRAVCSARSAALQHNRRLLKTVPVSDGVASPPRLDPLLKRLVADALDCEKPLSSTDIKHVASSGGISGGGSAGSLLKTGLGLFKSKGPAVSHAGDKSLLIVFVVGGVTASEVKHCREVLAAAGFVKTKQVVVASTRLLSDKDVVEALLAAES